MNTGIENGISTPKSQQELPFSGIVEAVKWREHARFSASLQIAAIPDDQLSSEDLYDFKYEFIHAGNTFAALVTLEEDAGKLDGFSAIVRYTYIDQIDGTEQNGFIATMGNTWNELVYMLHDAINLDYPDPSFIPMKIKEDQINSI